jgi:GAF domain-containing protein
MSFVSTFVAQVSQARAPDEGWQALEALAGAVVGHKLFTVMTTDMAAGVVRRAYSNRPSEYPTSGTKPLRGNTGEWFERVFNQRRSFVANTIEDIAKVFPDHELIGSMGLGSVINLPLVLGGELVAAVNLLDATGHYTPDRVRTAEEQLAVPGRLCAALARLFDAQSESAA